MASWIASPIGLVLKQQIYSKNKFHISVGSILGSSGNIKLASLIEMSIGAAVGAITFSGSIIAFLKLRGLMSGSPITFPGQHILNLFQIKVANLFVPVGLQQEF